MIRKIFFYTLVLVFFLLLPIIILYAFGFRWDADTSRLTRTGIVAIKTFPDAAEIYLNNDKLKQKTPASLSGLLPGDYDIELRLKGYWPYYKKVKVEADYVSRLEDVLFFTKEPKIKSILRPGEFDSFFLSPSGKQILYVATNKGDDNFYILDLAGKTLKAIGVLPADFVPLLKGVSVSWSNDEEIVLLQNQTFDYLLFLKNPKKSFFLNHRIGLKPNMVKLSKIRSSELYYLKDGRLHLFNIRKKKSRVLFASNIVDFETTSFGLIWLEAGSGEVYRSDRNGRNVKRFGSLRNFQGVTPIVWQASSKTLTPFDTQKWGGLDSQGNFYVLSPSFYHPNVKGFCFSPSGNQIIFWNEYELWLLKEDLSRKRGSGSPKYSRELIFESEIPIQNAFWSPEENYVFFLTHRKVYALELNIEGGTNLYPIYGSKDHFLRPNGWAINQKDGIFYWTVETPDRYQQVKSMHLIVNFFTPIVSRVVDRVEDFRDRVESTGKFVKKEEDESR